MLIGIGCRTYSDLLYNVAEREIVLHIIPGEPSPIGCDTNGSVLCLQHRVLKGRENFFLLWRASVAE